MRIDPISVPPDRLFVEIDVDLFGFEIFVDAPRSEFASEARLLIAAPWRFYVCGLHVVDPNDARANLLHRAEGLEDVSGPYRRRQSVRSVVGDLDGVGFVLEWNDGRNWAEDLFASDT